MNLDQLLIEGQDVLATVVVDQLQVGESWYHIFFFYTGLFTNFTVKEKKFNIWDFGESVISGVHTPNT